MLSLSLLIGVAYAVCVTTDPEDGIDREDSDCDGSPAVRRDYVSGFERLDDFDSHLATETGGTVTLSPQFFDNAWVELLAPLPFESGVLHVGVSVPRLTGAVCNLEVASTSTGYLTFALAEGVQEIDVPWVQPGDEITTLRVECSGAWGGEAVLDWLTVQNGPYTWPPLTDLQMSWSTMGYPNTGRQAVLRVSEAHETLSGMILMAGSDVGGFAWAEQHDPDPETGWGGYDPTVWRVANGRVDDFLDRTAMGVMDIWAECRGDEDASGECEPEEFDVYVLSGALGSTGSFWGTSNVADDDWELLDDDIGAFKHADDCDGIDDNDDQFTSISCSWSTRATRIGW